MNSINCQNDSLKYLKIISKTELQSCSVAIQKAQDSIDVRQKYRTNRPTALLETLMMMTIKKHGVKIWTIINW